MEQLQQAQPNYTQFRDVLIEDDKAYFETFDGEIKPFNEFYYDNELADVFNIFNEKYGLGSDEVRTLLINSDYNPEQRLNYLGRTINNLKSEISNLDDEKKAIDATKKEKENDLQFRLAQSQGIVDLFADNKKIKTDRFNFGYRKSASVEILDIDKLPQEVLILEPKANKKLIKEMIKDGEKVDGAELIEKENFSFTTKKAKEQ